MRNEFFQRSELLLGSDAMKKLNSAKVIIFGIGGVGGYAAEALVRSGVGNIVFVDNDCVSESNINRQIIATSVNVGQPKVEAMIQRARMINPDVNVGGLNIFYDAKTQFDINLGHFDYIVDAIDSVRSKLLLIENAKKANVDIISCMGAGNKTDPSAFQVSDISRTSVCPLAKIMRHELRARGIENLKVVFSTEPPRFADELSERSRNVIGSIAPSVGVAGLLMANTVVMDLIRK